jgi:low affinity Fe/Cu permease
VVARTLGVGEVVGSIPTAPIPFFPRSTLQMGNSGPATSKRRFNEFAKRMAAWAGRPSTFFAALLVILLWALTGPFFHFGDTWQLIINTSTTIVTFLMVFLIQNTQNRDTEAMQIKLDELIRSARGAHNALLDLEELDSEELDKIRKTYEDLAEGARRQLRKGQGDTGAPHVQNKK